MELVNVNILKCKFTLKKISASYYNNLDGHNYNVEDVEYPHPDLIKARDELKADLVKALYLGKDEEDYFSVDGFVIDEGDGITTVRITGQVTNLYEYVSKLNSGKIPLDEEHEELKVLIDTLKMELFKFFFKAKTSQGKLEGFPSNGDQELEMKETQKN